MPYNAGVDPGFFSREGELAGTLRGFFAELMGHGPKIETCYTRKLAMPQDVAMKYLSRVFAFIPDIKFTFFLASPNWIFLATQFTLLKSAPVSTLVLIYLCNDSHIRRDAINTEKG